MKIINLLKVLGLMTLVLSVMVGCASTTTDDSTQETPAAASPSPSEPSAAPMPKAAMPAVSSTSEYRVVRGDNLWDISGKSAVYGDPYQWPLIYKANQDQIKDADLIYPNQVFGIESASAAEVGVAIRHARIRGSWSLGVMEDSDKAYLAQ